MPAVRVGDLAEVMVHDCARRFGHDPEEVDIEIGGARPTERVHENLMSTEKGAQTRELEDMLVILPQIEVFGYDAVCYEGAGSESSEYASAARASSAAMKTT